MVKKKKVKLSAKEEKVIEKRLRHRLYERAKRGGGAFRGEFKKQALTAISAALGFLIALSWREPLSDGVKVLVDKIGTSGELLMYQFLSAVIVTILCVVGLVILTRWSSEKK